VSGAPTWAQMEERFRMSAALTARVGSFGLAGELVRLALVEGAPATLKTELASEHDTLAFYRTLEGQE